MPWSCSRSGASPKKSPANPMRVLNFLFRLLPVFWLLAGPGRAVEVKEGPVLDVSETTASVRWVTDVECGTQVKFGINANNFNRSVEGPVGVNHAVELTGLKSGTVYFYTIGTARKVLQTGSFSTKGGASGKSNGGAEGQGTTTAKKMTPPPVPPPAPPRPADPAMPRKAEKTATPEPPATKPGPGSYTPPPTTRTWGDMDSLQDHFVRHGRDFAAKSADDYAAKAWLFLQRAKDEGLPAKLDPDNGTIRVWDGASRTFAAYNRDFTTKTYFRPQSPDYFQRQPGKPVRLRHSPPPNP